MIQGLKAEQSPFPPSTSEANASHSDMDEHFGNNETDKANGGVHTLRWKVREDAVWADGGSLGEKQSGCP